jgi:anti-anti-sigma regulatory factor
MHVTVDQVSSRVPVTILAIHGDIDASNYNQVIASARELYAAGTRHLLLDLSDVPFMGSSGVVALHSIALLMRGEAPPDPEAGWQAFHAIDHARAGGVQQEVKLLGPQPKVARTLQMTSMSDFFEIHTDKQAAIDSF